MTNGKKIKTMKDDLLEIENNISLASEAQKSKPEEAQVNKIQEKKKAVSDFSGLQKKTIGRSSFKVQDANKEALENAVNRFSEKEDDYKIPSRAPQENHADFNKAEESPTPGENNELKELLNKISKRENEQEKPLNEKTFEKPRELIEENPEEQKPAEETLVLEKNDELQELLKKISKKEKTEDGPKPEKIDVKKEVFQEEKTDAKKEEAKKPENVIEEKITKPEKNIDTDYEGKKGNISEKKEKEEIKNDIEKKDLSPQRTEDIRNILEKMNQKEDELKDLLVKLSKQKEEIDKSSRISKEDKPLEPKKQEPLKKEKDSTKQSIPTTQEINSEKTTAQTSEKSQEEDSPMVRKIKERLFSPENETSNKTPESEDENRMEDKEYFKKITENKEKQKRNVEQIEEKFSNIPDQKKENGQMNLNKIDALENSSGVIAQKKKVDLEKKKLLEEEKDYKDAQEYTSPENRLIFGKQEHYSSIRKKIEERSSDNELQELKKKTEVKQIEHLSDKEEKKKLRQRILSKYHISSSSSFKKILVVGLIAVVIFGVALWSYLSNFKPVLPPIIINKQIGQELAEFSSFTDNIEITDDRLKNPSALREEADKKFSSSSNLEYFKLAIKDKEGDIVSPEKAMEGIGLKTKNLPKKFMPSIENEYGLLVFRTPAKTNRLGIAFKLKSKVEMESIMREWEKDKVMMAEVLSPLFMADRTSDASFSYFAETNYKNTQIRYISLPDKNTAIDYFIHNEILVIATSKDDIFKMADILANDN